MTWVLLDGLAFHFVLLSLMGVEICRPVVMYYDDTWDWGEGGGGLLLMEAKFIFLFCYVGILYTSCLFC